MAKSSAFSVEPSVSVALELPVLTTIVPVGFVSPYLARSFPSGSTMPCICVEERRSSAPSTAAKSARTEIGDASRQSEPLLARRVFAVPLVSSSPSTLSRSKTRIRRSRRANGVLVERGIEKRRDEEHPLLIGKARVEIAAGRRLLADLQAPEILLPLRSERDLDPGRLEPVLLQVARVLVDDALDLERGETARDRGHLARVGSSLDRLDELPLAVGLLEARRLAVGALDLHFLDVVGLQRGERLLLDGRCRPARCFESTK